jgi:DNA-binding beta-propeller fold protein YncE
MRRAATGKTRGLAAGTVAAALAVLLAGFGAADAGAAKRATLKGRVLSGARPLPGFEVTLYRSRGRSAIALASARSGRKGRFRLSYRSPGRDAVVYVVAGRGRARTLAAVLGVGRRVPGRAVVDERTTVAAGFAMAQFVHGERIAGRAPGPRNAAGMARNLVAPRSGRPAGVLRRAPNGGRTSTLRTFNSLANMALACVRERASCARLFRLARPPGGRVPRSILAAVAAIARNPANNRRGLFRLSRAHRVYAPARGSAPTAWFLALRFAGDGRTMSGPGAFAIDARGNVWVANNYEYARPRTVPVCGSELLLKFTPRGRYFPGSPYEGGGVSGVGFGIALDPEENVWTGNFGFAAPPPGCPEDRQPKSNSVSEFNRQGRPLSPEEGFTQGNISWPQAVASSRKGDIWIANCGNDSVTHYPRGLATSAQSITGLGLEKPFGLAVGRGGRAFVSGLISSTVAVLNPDGTPTALSPVAGRFLSNPMGVATDSRGNAWIANSGMVDIPCPPPAEPSLEGHGGSIALLDHEGRPTAREVSRGAFTGGGLTIPWGIAVDGADNVWVANFAGRRLSHFCGARPRNCPPGLETGEPISPSRGYRFDGLARNTGVAVDPSGNVWLANNWKRDPLVPVEVEPGVTKLVAQNPGDFQIVAFVGLASPVRTPLLGPVRSP